LGAGGVFNVGQGRAHTLLEVVDLLEDIIGTKLQLLHIAGRAGDVRHTQADISEAQRCLGYTPEISFEEGLSRTVAYLGKQIAWSLPAQV
jgi:nucleoside-diphosphate-sugar epimerase